MVNRRRLIITVILFYFAQNVRQAFKEMLIFVAGGVLVDGGYLLRLLVVIVDLLSHGLLLSSLHELVAASEPWL